MNIHLVDLKKQYLSIKDEIDTAISDVINNTAFIKGKYVKEFEENYKTLIGTKHCISVANGTDAIYITLKALGIGPGDEVITVANSWISTSETISQTGATPIFVDIDPETYTIDTTKIAEKINPNTKAIIPVHIFGHPCDMTAIMTIANEHNLHVIEDCAQSHLATFESKKVSTFGIAGTYSFFPGKNLGAFGDAGGIVTNDDTFAETARMIANHGALVKHQHKIEGINSRLDGLQAAILNVKLNYIEAWTEQRIKNAAIYTQLIQEKGIDLITTPTTTNNCKHVFHLYVIRTEKRNELATYLSENGISNAIHYPTPLPFLEAYSHLGYTKQDLPVVSDYQNQILSLPMYPELTESEIEYIVNSIAKFYQ